MAPPCSLQLPTRARSPRWQSPNPGVFEWDLTGSINCRSAALREFPGLITDKDTAVPSRSATAVCDQVSGRNATVPLYPALSVSLVWGSAYQETSQRHSKSLSYQEGSRLDPYHHSTQGPLLAGKFGPSLQSYGSRALAQQPGTVMVLKVIQPTDVQPPVCTSTNYHPVPAEHSKPPEAYGISKENQIPSLLPLVTLNVQQPLSCFYADSQKQRPVSYNTSMGKNSLSVDKQEAHENLVDSSTVFADKSTLVPDTHHPHLLTSLRGLHQFQDPILLDGAPRGKIHHHGPGCPGQGEVAEGSAGTGDRPSEKTARHSSGSAQKPPSSRSTITNGPWQEKSKRRRENNTKKSAEQKQARTRVKSEEKPANSKRKRKRNPPELSKESFKKPRTHLSTHMLESVQVFDALGKRSDRKARLSTSSAVENCGSTTELRPCPAITSQLGIPCEGKVPGKTQGPGQNSESDTEKGGLAPSIDKLPPPGKLKLVPLPFLTLDEPQVRAAVPRPLSLASSRSRAAYPARPHPISTQLITVNASQSAPSSTCLVSPTKPVPTISVSATRPSGRNSTQSGTVSHVDAARPAPYKTSSHRPLQKKPVSAALTKDTSPPKNQSQYLLQDFSCQPIPWRKVNIPGPLISHPITTAQRPEREAMKRRAQQEREKAANYTALRNQQVFLQRENDMEISRYYDYAM
ncbi:uncharacterized protein C2orf78-like [Nannospalax galili]|uniref:uncharacterized protein C2orf78-like n=1 Tax=Nannospalax galili TaxID=1026970 RepID=UPI00111C67AD|nr:uncharacterized protein C2orf78-like [Nannospalax galili]